MYRAGLAAVAPGAALERALAGLAIASSDRPWLFALGKAAVPMAASAVAVLRRHGAEPSGGVVVAPEPGEAPHAMIVVAQGDHPEPGAGSFAAAALIGRTAARVRSGDEAWVLLSGGATSLAAAPIAGVSESELTALFALLLRSGLDIAAMNTVRKRFSRWGGGRLAVALAPARLRVFAISDVAGDDLAAIGSGPCTPDPATVADVRRLLERASLLDRVPSAIRTALDRAEHDPQLETRKAGDRAFRGVETRIIANNALALDAIAREALARGISLHAAGGALSGEAAAAGRRIVRDILAMPVVTVTPLARGAAERCLIAGGETVVALGDIPAGMLGGRSQELALAAARELRTTGAGRSITVLAAGTDGRDGPTDAAGAVVDGETWDAIRCAGRDPERDLAAHDAYRALDAAGALLRTGPTGTNVMDVVIALRRD
ncbi:MAG: DUF4147 domain-containing protein [Gemmatimonadota bacterium]|nr:DUF4147 domain-containing protein [Gemmatimonadota bacterium]